MTPAHAVVLHSMTLTKPVNTLVFLHFDYKPHHLISIQNISGKYIASYLISLISNQTFKPRHAVIGRLGVTRCAVALPLNASLTASFSSGSIWILRSQPTTITDNYWSPFLLLEDRSHHGRQEEPYQVFNRVPQSVLCRFRLVLREFRAVWGWYSDAFSRSVSPFFSLYARARIVHRHYGGFSLPTLPDTLRQRENFCGYAWHSRKLYSVSTELVRSSMSNGHYLTFVLLANMLSPELKYVASLLASHTSDTTKCCI